MVTGDATPSWVKCLIWFLWNSSLNWPDHKFNRMRGFQSDLTVAFFEEGWSKKPQPSARICRLANPLIIRFLTFLTSQPTTLYLVPGGSSN
jgi:hypothetical protein